MTRYTEYLKEKILCEYCACMISKGHRQHHIKTLKHIKNLDKYYNDKINKDSEIKKSIKEI